jgi:hypothetical protein
MIRGAEIDCTEALAAGVLKLMGHFLSQMFMLAQKQMNMIGHIDAIRLPLLIHLVQRKPLRL